MDKNQVKGSCSCKSYVLFILHTRLHVKVPYKCVGLANLSSQPYNLCRRKVVENKLAFSGTYDSKSTSFYD